MPHHMVYTDHSTSMLLMINITPSLVSGNEATLYNTTRTKLFSASGSMYLTWNSTHCICHSDLVELSNDIPTGRTTKILCLEQHRGSWEFHLTNNKCNTLK